MKPYFYKATISNVLLQHIASNASYFGSTMASSVNAFGGKLIRCHVMASSGDPIGFLEFPDDLAARAWNAFYGSQEGVLTSRISRLLDETDLGEMHGRVSLNKAAAMAHR